MSTPTLLVLDEAVSALDVLVQKEIISMLKELKSKLDITYLFISHDLRAVRSLADTVVVMRQGRVVEMAGCDMIFKTPREPYTRVLLKAALNYEVSDEP